MKWIKSVFLMVLYLAFISQGSLYSYPTLTQKTNSCKSESHGCCNSEKSPKAKSTCCGSTSCCNTSSSQSTSGVSVSYESHPEIKISKKQSSIQKSHLTFFDITILKEFYKATSHCYKLVFNTSKTDFQSLFCVWIC